MASYGKYRQNTASCQAAGQDDGKLPPAARIGLAALAAGAGVALGTLAFAWGATHPPRRRVRPGAKDELPVEEVIFPSRDGLKIGGWFAPAENAQGGVILCHGHPSNRTETLFMAKALHAAGFHVLLFDFRAMGESEGQFSSIGHHEIQDLLGAADYCCERPEMDGLRMGVYGISMGGAVALMTAAQDERFAAVATHGAYASLDRAITQRGRMFLGPLGPALAKSATFWGRLWMDTDPRTVSPVDVIAKIAPRPLLLLHGLRDIIVHPQDARRLYDAADSPKMLRTLPRSWHLRVHPEEFEDYKNLVTAFFQTNL